MKHYIFFVFLFLGLTFSACYQSVDTSLPTDTLSQEKMVDILVDVHMAEGYLAGLPSHGEKDTLAGIYYASIFKVHNIDSATFNYNMNAYMKAPNDLLAVYNKVLEKLEKEHSQSSDN